MSELKMGKTALALDIAMNAVTHGKQVLFCSFEMEHLPEILGTYPTMTVWPKHKVKTAFEIMRNHSHALVCGGCDKRTALTPHEAQIWQDGVEELEIVATCKACGVGEITLVSTENTDDQEITH